MRIPQLEKLYAAAAQLVLHLHVLVACPSSMISGELLTPSIRAMVGPLEIGHLRSSSQAAMEHSRLFAIRRPKILRKIDGEPFGLSQLPVS